MYTHALMAQPKYVKPTPIVLKGNPSFNEKWVQDRIVEDPSLLGLGDVFVKDKERSQPRAGRLDLLLQDKDERRRYEVELQLGPTDESHIIRCIEYFDFERRRYQQFDHCAVLIAEDITSRFLNVISLFGGFVPFIAIQLKAIQIGDTMTLAFTRVVDELSRGIDEDEDAEYESADRPDWEKASSPESMGIIDQLFAIIREFEASATPNYTRGYISVQVNGKANNFAWFTPKKSFCRMAFRLPHSDDTDKEIDDSGMVKISYSRWGAYQVRVNAEDLDKHRVLITKWLKASYDYYA